MGKSSMAILQNPMKLDYWVALFFSYIQENSCLDLVTEAPRTVKFKKIYLYKRKPQGRVMLQTKDGSECPVPIQMSSGYIYNQIHERKRDREPKSKQLTFVLPGHGLKDSVVISQLLVAWLTVCTFRVTSNWVAVHCVRRPFWTNFITSVQRPNQVKSLVI